MQREHETADWRLSGHDLGGGEVLVVDLRGLPGRDKVDDVADPPGDSKEADRPQPREARYPRPAVPGEVAEVVHGGGEQHVEASNDERVLQEELDPVRQRR